MNQNSTFQHLIDNHLLSFYGWWQLVVCLFAFIGLMAIWWHIGRKQKDVGQIWLALSVLCWSFSGAVEVYFANQIQSEQALFHSQLNELLSSTDTKSLSIENIDVIKNNSEKIATHQLAQAYQLDGWRSILSLFNSLFILLALPWFRYIPKRIENIVKSKYWQYIVGLPFLFSLLPTISKMMSGKTYGLISELDVYYAILTLGFLGYVLWESFAKRRLTILAYLSIVTILITFIAQIYKFTSSPINLTLFSAIFKTSLIMIFFALALSWVKELSENVLPSAEQLRLHFDRKKNDKNKWNHIVQIKGIPGKDESDITLTPTLYELFLKFAKSKANSKEDWLEIKPKNDERSSRTYDINDHNEIKRLTAALLDGIFGKGSWTKNQHELPLKATLFEMSEKRDQKIRLRVPADNISFSTD